MPSSRRVPKPKKFRLPSLLTSLLLLAVAVPSIWFGYSALTSTSESESTTIPTAVARVMDLRDKVVDQGEIESQSTVNGKCEIDHWENKIIFLAPEGKHVKKGEVVCKFDTAYFTKEVDEATSRLNERKAETERAKQEIVVQEDTNKTTIRDAEQAVKFAELDLQKYMEGDYEVTKFEMQFAISEAETALDKATRDMKDTRVLVDRGFAEYERLREAVQQVKSAKIGLGRDERKLASFEKFDHVKSKAEFEGKLSDAKKKLEAAKTTAKAKLQQAKDSYKNYKERLKHRESRLKEYQKNLDLHEMKAPQDGTLAYARNDWRGQGEKMHEGAVIYRDQPVFVLPDMSRMQVKVGVHESLVSKVKPKQKAIVRIDAFSGQSLRGTVKSVSPLSASSRFEASNNYHVIVTIDRFPKEMLLKPGMTAEVEILVGQYNDVLAVPIQGVASFGRKKFVFVKNGKDFEKREVELGDSSISFVEVSSGLEADEVIALDAYQRAIVEFGDQEPEEEDETELLAAETEAEGAADDDDDSQIGKTSDESDKEGWLYDEGEQKKAEGWLFDGEVEQEKTGEGMPVEEPAVEQPVDTPVAVPGGEVLLPPVTFEAGQ